MSEKYINFDMDDERAGAIAEVLANKTCKKILSLIAEREMSAGDISSELGLPMNTIGYNIEKLLKSGLIEKSKNFFWSAKGKKIATYRVSNKKIVISPKTMYRGILPAVLLSGAIALGIKFYDYINSSANDQYFYAPSTVSKAADSALASGSSVVNQTASNYSIFQNAGIWFFLGAMSALFIFLIWNNIKMKGGNKNE